jgi:multidrug resistance efflux pump
MNENTQEEALRKAVAPVGQALKETEVRCAALGQFVNDCNAEGTRSPSHRPVVQVVQQIHVRAQRRSGGR